MNKCTSIFFILILCAMPAYADETDQALPRQTSEQLRTNTREMIRLGIHSDEAIKMTGLMVNSRFREETAIEAQQIVMDAKKQGLPEGAVMSKAYEGIAKNVQPGNIVQAMEKTRARYAYAYDKAQKLGVSGGELAATGNVIAEGMAAGLRNRDVDALCDGLQTRDRLRDTDAAQDKVRDQKRDRDQLHTLAQESFMTAREMVRRGVPSDVAADAVGQALENNYEAREMQQLRNAFMHNATSGDPVQLANRYANALRHGAHPDDPDISGGHGHGSAGTASGADSHGSGSSGSGSGNGSGSGSDGGHGGSRK